ncbi:hypothetical protein [Clostridium saccharoperbutylacetonicum]|uniref:hypothetical protein n=1 Tax=Clostridium saccharoperbutylacetonicum TaxID=36745 RepID=UPI0039ED120A
MHTSEGVSSWILDKKLCVRSLPKRHLSEMPYTKKYIEIVKENNRDFHIKKIKWVIRELDEEGQEVLSWKVFRKAGIRYEYHDKLEQYINNKINI